MSDASPPPRRLHWAIHAGFAIACGVFIGSFAYINAWQSSPGQWQLFAAHNLAVDQMWGIERYLDDYQKQHSNLPNDLSELRPLIDDRRIAAFDANDHPLDPWGHPFVYRVVDGGYELLSYGRDGAAGGVTLDADFLRESPLDYPGPGSATLRQFTFELPTGWLQLGCVLADGCTAIACLVLMKKTAGDPLFFRLVAWGITLWSAFFGAMLIASLHVMARH